MADWQIAVLTLAAPVVLCANRLGRDFWYDEMYSIRRFAGVSFHHIVTDYSAPNNHPLFSILLRLTWLVSDSEFVIRFPSFLLGVGTLALTFALGRRLGGVAAAVAASLTLGLNQMFITHAVQARGYSLSMFLAALLAWLIWREGGHTWRRYAAIAFTGAAFLYCIPTNLLIFIPLAGAGLVRAARAGVAPRWKPPAAWGAAVALAGLAYLPIAHQVIAVGAGQRDRSIRMAWTSALDYLRPALHDFTWLVPVAVVGLVLAYARRRELRAMGVSRSFVGTIALMHVVPFALTGLLGSAPFPRNFTPILPFTAWALGACLAETARFLVQRIGVKHSESWAAAVAGLGIAAVVGPQLATYPERLDAYRQSQPAQDGYYNFYAARFHPSELVRYLGEVLPTAGATRVCFDADEYYNLVYYLEKYAMSIDYGEPNAPRTLFVITRPLTDLDKVAENSRVPRSALSDLTLIRDFGYYRLYRSNRRFIVPSGSTSGEPWRQKSSLPSRSRSAMATRPR